MASRNFKIDHQEVTPSDRAVALDLLSQPSGRAHQHVERFLSGGATPGRLRIVVRFHDGKRSGSQVWVELNKMAFWSSCCGITGWRLRSI